MSLIEQAAKRLEELRRAGAEEPVGSPALHADPKDRLPARPEHVPTPEALVREISAREALSSPAAAEPVAPAGNRPPPRNDSAGAEARAPAQVEIDLARLKSQGYVTPDEPQSLIADEFRVVKRTILRNTQGQGDKRIRNSNLVLVTSSLQGEGKTFTAANLAISIAMEFDNTVLLVDGDVAHPALPNLLGTPKDPGLLDLLTRDDLEIGDVVRTTNIEGLSILPAGTRNRRATELLASEKMALLLGELASSVPDRIIIFDSPPLLATTEARVLSTHMGQIVMVVAADSTSQHAVRQALATIENCEVVLMLLNKSAKTDVGTYYGY
ncbi:MAG TPA: XrtA-associated tyrosine autokinase [Casimicrobiaceae bacterium]|nr:XrtA-associated tyrosine autokinase [Casimicrobiaceae bacterium]